jgi:beta-fructofuranosidase
MLRREFLRVLPAAALAAPATDRHRPRFHFMPPTNWMNDPNGPIWWKGKHHLFYQYNPNGAFHGTIHWGHAESTDLVNWKHLPIALAPTPGSPDKDGIYTGCAVNNNGVPVIIYTGIRPEVQMIATGDDNLVNWKKSEANPVIAAPPLGMQVAGFRDPCVWKEGSTWHMLLGSGIKGVEGMALLYRSPDLHRWEYVHKFHSAPHTKYGHMWECPDFFPLGGKQVLIISAYANTPWMVGGAYERRFTAEREGNTDYGCGYAPKTYLDDKGRRIYWAWLRERRTREAQIAAGWSGVMSLPRVLSLWPDSNLRMAPAPEVEALRGRKKSIGGRAIKEGDTKLLGGVAAICHEIEVEIAPGDAKEIGLRLRATSGGEEQTIVGWRQADQSLFSDATKSSSDPQTTRAVQSGPLRLAPEEPLKLRIFVDASVIEVFADSRACLTDRVYPTRADATGVGLYAKGGTARLTSMTVWEMKAAEFTS